MERRPRIHTSLLNTTAMPLDQTVYESHLQEAQLEFTSGFAIAPPIFVECPDSRQKVRMLQGCAMSGHSSSHLSHLQEW